MKIVHTGDWHVGKSLRGRSRSDEHRAVLEELRAFLEKERIDLLLVAGDIFDSFSPSAEAEAIVYQFLHDVSRLKIPAILIAGNHDSGLRFEAIASLMAIAGVTMVGFIPMEKPRQVQVIGADGTKANIIPVPFIPERTFIRADNIAETNTTNARFYSRQIGRLLRTWAESFDQQAINIVVSHLLMHGARPGGGERQLYLGDNYAVYPEEIPAQLSYMALGHIHLSQEIQAASPVCYCGSLLQLDFSEAQTQKGFILIETSPQGQCHRTFIPCKSGRQLLQLEGFLPELVKMAEEQPQIREAYLKVTVREDSYGTGTIHQLKKLFPNALDIRREYKSSPAAKPLPSDNDWFPKLYEEFYRKQYEKELPELIRDQFQLLYQKHS